MSPTSVSNIIMATQKKKNNYIVYELKRLEKYVQQLQDYLDNVNLENLDDRLDVRYSQNGNPIVKVIARKEDIVKAYRENLEKLPAMYETLNRLRSLADNGDVEAAPEKARGGKELPGIFKSKMLGTPKEYDEEDNDEDWEEEE